MTYSPTSTLRFAMLSGMVKPSMVGSKGLKSSRAIYTCTRYQASITPKPKSPASSLLVSKRTPKQYDHSRNSIRLVSTASTSPNPTPDSSSSVSASNLKYASPTSTDLTWARFLRLRRTRRLYNLAASTSTGLLSCYIGINYLVMQDIDKLASQFGLDPVIMMGIATAGFGAAGILVGPMVGSGIFGLVHRGAGRGFAAKEKDFYHRIKRYRADPTGQSLSNPLPDWHGEKIDSIGAYRTWLKDQRAFNKKRQIL